MSKFKDLLLTASKTLNPKYYTELGERDLKRAFRYFFAILFVAFILMFVLALPKLIFTKAQLDKDVLNIAKLKINIEFETSKPILIPNENPLISLDTTGNRTIQDELFLVTNKGVSYNLKARNGTFEYTGYDYAQSRSQSTLFFFGIFLLILPSIFFFYYIVYLMKYIAILSGVGFLFFLFVKMLGNKITLKQSFTLSLYTSTIMILLEVLFIPFVVKKYLAYFSFLGIGFSVVALTAYLTLYVTAVRLNGSKHLRY